jgi:hypothetical protein
LSGTARAVSIAVCFLCTSQSMPNGQHRRAQEQEADDRAALEVLLADDELEDVGREHVEVAADHLRDAEVGHHERERDQRRRDQAVLRAGQRDRPELAPRRRAERVGGLVETRVGKRERAQQDHQRVREDGEALGDDDPGAP